MTKNTKHDVPDWLILHHVPTTRPEHRHSVHLWCCDVDDPALLPFCDGSVLTPKERERARAHKYPRRRLLYTRQRALQRFLLGRFLGVSAEAVRLAESDLGKPRLAPPNPARCGFSASESENILALGITEGAEIGVDVQFIQPGWDWEAVAETVLDAGRKAWLAKLPPEERTDRFRRFWSLRDAFSRVTGYEAVGAPQAGVPPEQVWDLVFATTHRQAAGLPPGWSWTQLCDRVGAHDVLLSVARRQA